MDTRHYVEATNCKKKFQTFMSQKFSEYAGIFWTLKNIKLKQLSEWGKLTTLNK